MRAKHLWRQVTHLGTCTSYGAADNADFHSCFWTLPSLQWAWFLQHIWKNALAIFALFLRLQCQPVHSQDEHNSHLLIRCRLEVSIFLWCLIWNLNEIHLKYFLKIISERERLCSKEWESPCLQPVPMHGTWFALPLSLDLLTLCQVICVGCRPSSTSEQGFKWLFVHSPWMSGWLIQVCKWWQWGSGRQAR